MAPGTLIVLEGSLAFGVPLLLAVCELVAISRSRGGPGGPGDPRDDSPTPLPPGPEAGLPSLPDCLTVRRTDSVVAQARKDRVAEPV